MTLAVVVCLVVVVGVAAARVAHRVVADERHSVRDYQHTLETLRHIGDRGTPGRGALSAPRRTTKVGSPSSGARPRSRPSRPAQQDEEVRSDLGFDDTAVAVVGPVSNGNLASTDGLAAGARAHRARPHPHRTTRRARPGGGRRAPASVAAAAALVVVAGVVAGVVLSPSPAHRVRSAVHPVTRPASSQTTGTAAPSVLEPVQATSSAATYQAPASPLVVQLSATGPCWVMATDAATGTVLWTGTITAGETRTLPTAEGMNVRLGAASYVTLTANGRPVQLPAGFRSPFVVTFVTA